MREEVHRLYVKYNKEYLSRTTLPWYIPEWLGGLGLTGVRKPNELNLRQAQAILFNWNVRQPYPLGGVAAKWKVWDLAKKKLPKPYTVSFENKGVQAYEDAVNKEAMNLLLDSDIQLSDLLTSEDGGDAAYITKKIRHNEKLWKIKPGPLPQPVTPESIVYRKRWESLLPERTKLTVTEEEGQFEVRRVEEKGGVEESEYLIEARRKQHEDFIRSTGAEVRYELGWVSWTGETEDEFMIRSDSGEIVYTNAPSPIRSQENKHENPYLTLEGGDLEDWEEGKTKHTITSTVSECIPELELEGKDLHTQPKKLKRTKPPNVVRYEQENKARKLRSKSQEREHKQRQKQLREDIEHNRLFPGIGSGTSASDIH
jgi:hypothetical protein